MPLESTLVQLILKVTENIDGNLVKYCNTVSLLTFGSVGSFLFSCEFCCGAGCGCCAGDVGCAGGVSGAGWVSSNSLSSFSDGGGCVGGVLLTSRPKTLIS